MSSLWDSIKDKACDLGNAAGTASLRTKLRAERMLIDREMNQRRAAFGVACYDHVAPLTRSQDFYAANDLLTETIRPHMIVAQREIAALDLKRRSLKEEMNQADVQRKAAFARAATNWQDKLKNAGKSTAMAGNEAKLKTEMAMANSQVIHYKQEFGQSVYAEFEKLEDTKGWLPTSREIRTLYDACRKDIEEMKKRKDEKSRELAQLGDYSTGSNEQKTPQVSVYKTDRNDMQTSGTQLSTDPYAYPGTTSQQGVGYGAPQPTPALPQGFGAPPSHPPTLASEQAGAFGTTSTPQTHSAQQQGYGATTSQPQQQGSAAFGYAAPMPTQASQDPFYATTPAPATAFPAFDLSTSQQNGSFASFGATTTTQPVQQQQGAFGQQHGGAFGATQRPQTNTAFAPAAPQQQQDPFVDLLS